MEKIWALLINKHIYIVFRILFIYKNDYKKIKIRLQDFVLK
jgi:hypothetical protein